MSFLIGKDAPASAAVAKQDPVGVSAIVVGASPFVYANNSTDADGDIDQVSVLVIGGTVTLIEYSRDGNTYYPVGMLAGMVLLDPNDMLRVSYMVAPTMVLIPH
jgi:hypothetical protein